MIRREAVKRRLCCRRRSVKIGDVRKRECERRMLLVRKAVKKKGLLQRKVGNWGSRKEERVLERR